MSESTPACATSQAGVRLGAALVLTAGALPFPGAAAAQESAQSRPAPVSPGHWVQVFAPDVERVLGRSVRIDATSVSGSSASRSFREAEVLLRPNRDYPRGTTIVSQRTVDCVGSRVTTSGWQVIGPNGASLGAFSGGGISKIVWDTEDGRVLRYICQGVLPR